MEVVGIQVNDMFLRSIAVKINESCVSLAIVDCEPLP
jgi:hypothetical protein